MEGLAGCHMPGVFPWVRPSGVVCLGSVFWQQRTAEVAFSRMIWAEICSSRDEFEQMTGVGLEGDGQNESGVCLSHGTLEACLERL